MPTSVDDVTVLERLSRMRWLVPELIVALVVTAVTLVAVSAPAAAAGAPTVTISISGGSILAGENGTLNVSASNTGAIGGYNLGFFLDVPIGMAFVSSDLGIPIIYNSGNQPPVPLAAGMQRWVWEDVEDLPVGGRKSGTVTVSAVQPTPGSGETSDTAVSPVGSSVTITAHSALSGDPTYLPVFNGSTGVSTPPAVAATGTSGAATVTVDIVSLRISASEPSPEAELLRGVVNQATTRTLTVRATTEGDTTGAVLLDFLPAGLEFLGCGTVDNSTVDRDIADAPVNEYDGASPLSSTADVATQCLTPYAVDTIVADASLATSFGLTQGAVYTRIEWSLGTLAAGSTTIVKYAAGVPLQENTMTWDGPTPTDISLLQAANLDNNNGPSTRHGDVTPIDGYVWTSVATAYGDYAGVVRTGTDRGVGDKASVSVFAMDLSVIKSVAAEDSDFVVGNVADFTLHLRTGTYMSSADIVLTDEVPNGLCPLLPAGVTLTLDSGASVPIECEATGTVTGGDLISATAHTDGTFTVILRPTDGGTPDAFVLNPDSTHDIRYQALNRGSYVTASQYGSTTSGDGFHNTVSFTATTSAIPALVGTYPEVLQVWDDSGATIHSDLTTISKKVLERDDVTKDLAPGADPCTAGTFVDTPVTNFRLGDTVCFELSVYFPGSIDTRNPVVTDFLPAGLTYAGSAVAAASTAPLNGTVVDNSGTTAGSIVWTLGTPGAGGDLYVPLGNVFIAHVWATVDLPSNGLVLDKPENLMKYRQQNVDGDLYFLRTQAAVTVDPELQLTKGVLSVTDTGLATSSTRTAGSQDAVDGTTFLSNRDHIQVRESEKVTYRVDLHGLPYDASQTEVWDLLPVGITKADVANVSDAGVAYDPADGSYPSGMSAGNSSRSVVIWTGITVPGGQKTLTYDVTIPVGTGVTTTLTNTASLIQYSASIDSSTNPNAQAYVPANSLDTVRSAASNTDGAGTTDNSDVYLPSPTVGKTATSAATTNNLDSQVVKGEIAQFDYSVTIPARTTVHGAVLTDVIANSANWTTVPGSTTVAHPGGTTTAGDPSFVWSGQTFTVTTATGTVAFPATYTNATDSDQVFAVHLEGYINSASAWTHNTSTSRSDTATFTSTGKTAITSIADVKLIEPSPTLTKAADDTTVTATQAITYTLTATNASGRPTLFDTTVTDCVPLALTSVTVTSPASGWTVDPASCGSGNANTLITWAVGDVVAGTPATLTYTVVVSASSAGDAQYTNSASLTGYSLPSGALDRKAYTASDTETVTVVGATMGKTVDQPTAVIGEERAYTLTGTIPANVNFYDAIIVDAVPAGMTVSGITVSCLDSALASCDGDLPGGAAPLVPSGTLRGWWLGDIASDPLVRTVEVTYTGTVLDVVGNARPGTLVNSASMHWNIVDTETSPPSLPYAGTASTADAHATVTITEPNVGVSKLVNGAASATVNPGATFSYGVKATNSGTSTAYDVTVTDTVPVGVVVTGGTISNGGVLTGNGANGGGTITWTLAAIAGSGGSASLTYDATLASSLTLTDAALTNTATATKYFSHPLATTGFDDGQLRQYGPVSTTANVTPGFPALTVTKVATSGVTAYINAPHTFTVTIKNTGNGPATGVVASDVLPAGFAYVSGSTKINTVVAGDPSIVGQTLTWSTLPDRNPNASDVIEYKATAQPAYPWDNTNTGSSVNHTNTVTSTANDTSGAPRNLSRIFTGQNTATVHINDANLNITKSHATPVVAGANTAWTITVSNAGPDAAVGPIVVTDQLPTGATLVGISGTGWVAGTPNGSNVVTFTRAATINSGSSSPITVTLSFPASTVAGTNADNTACVAAKTFDSNTSDNCATNPGAVITLADLMLQKTAVDATYTAGTAMSWTLKVTNNGPSDSQAPFSVTDNLPPAIDWNTATASGTGWTCGAVNTGTGAVTCTRATGTLTPTSNLPLIAVAGTVDSGFTGTLTNTATVTGTTTEPASPGLANNTATVNTIAGNAEADLSLVKTVWSTDLVAGGQGRYLIDVTNGGPSDATTVIVTDQLPAGLTYAGSLTSAPGDTWSCAADGTIVGQVNCALDSNATTLPNGAHTWFSFDVDVASSVTGLVTNTAVVSSDANDPDPSNNTDTASQLALVETNVSVSKTHPTGPTYLVGDEVAFTITVTNDGIADAANVVVTDTLPAGIAFARTESDAGWTVTGPDVAGVLTLTLDNPLPSGVSPVTASIVVVGTLGAASCPSATNAVDVTTTTSETTTSDNHNTDAVTVSSPDLEIVKTADATVVQGGDTFAFTLSVRNVDVDAGADAVTVTDTIPYDLRVLTDPADIGGAPWTCSLTGADGDGYGGVLVCDLATLAFSASAPDLVYSVGVLPAVARDTITNTASVASPDEHSSLVDARNVSTVSATVKWIDFSATSVCTNEAPWFQYTIDAHNVANGLPVTLTWYPDADANGIPDGASIATQTLGSVTTGAPLTDEILWPGAAVDAYGVAIAWPGWRTVTVGETPTFENQIQDPTLPEYALLAGALVTVQVDPESSITTTYPLTTPVCEVARDVAYDVDLNANGSQFHRGDTFTYTAEVSNISYGASNDVVLTVSIPADVKVLGVSPALSTDPTIPDWLPCTVTGQDAEGYGGTVECVLDGWLGYGQRAPDVMINAKFSATASLGALSNLATVTWTDPDIIGGPSQNATDPEVVSIVLSAAELLALTGITSTAGLLWAAGLVAIGTGMVAFVRRRRSSWVR